MKFGVTPGILAGLGALVLYGCGDGRPPVGSVAIKTPRGLIPLQLMIDKDSAFSSAVEKFTSNQNGNPVIHRRPPGQYILKLDRESNPITLCKFEVRKDRITTITLKPSGREYACQIV
jgi:hypothetical protein